MFWSSFLLYVLLRLVCPFFRGLEKMFTEAAYCAACCTQMSKVRLSASKQTLTNANRSSANRSLQQQQNVLQQPSIICCCFFCPDEFSFFSLSLARSRQTGSHSLGTEGGNNISKPCPETSKRHGSSTINPFSSCLNIMVIFVFSFC